MGVAAAVKGLAYKITEQREVNIPNTIPITGFWAVTAASAEISVMWWVAGMANPVWAKIKRIPLRFQSREPDNYQWMPPMPHRPPAPDTQIRLWFRYPNQESHYKAFPFRR